MIWRSMFDETCRQKMIGRLRSLTPDSPRRWGRMTAPQMIAHLTDQMRHALEDAPVQPRSGPLRLSPVRWASIYLVPWPKGRIQGPSEAFVTQPASWPSDVAALETLLERFVARGPDSPWPEHALMGRMSGRDWGVFVHKHFDHHFRQFGA
jgi:hypothetical protein